MKIIRNLNQIKNQLPSLALTIGNFDGVHLGHQEIIKQIKETAKTQNLSSAILTFEPHPLEFLRPDLTQDFRIMSLADKLRIFREFKIDYIIILPFNTKLAEITAKSFVEEILHQKLNIKHLTIGYDFTFGKNREGNFRLLEQESKRLGFGLSEVAAVKNNDYTCSSSIIRSFIKNAEIKKVDEILGQNFFVSGIVIEGKKLARQLGFPTANFIAKKHLIKPKFGVYKSITYIPHLNRKFNSITNFGVRPTINKLQEQTIIPLYETHIFGYKPVFAVSKMGSPRNHAQIIGARTESNPIYLENLYGKKIIVELLDFMREEKKFNSAEDLKKQIKLDVETCLS